MSSECIPRFITAPMRRSCHILTWALLTVLTGTLGAQETSPPSESCRFQDDPTDCRDSFLFFHKLRVMDHVGDRVTLISDTAALNL